MERVEITRWYLGICYMQVCAVSDATDQEILFKCNMDNPSGTSNGWSVVFREDCEEIRRRPGPCADYEGRIHFVVAC